MAKEYKSWEILKMIQEHKLTPKDILISDNGFKFKIGTDGCLLYNDNGRKEMPSSYLKPGCFFTIEEKPVTFKEAMNSGKRIKPVTWEAFHTVSVTFEKLAENTSCTIRTLINELWNIEKED